MAAIVMVVILVVGYAWSVWLLWRQMHFEESRTTSRRHAEGLGRPSLVSTRSQSTAAARSGVDESAIPQGRATDRARVPASTAHPAADSEMLNVRQEIEARVYRLESLLDRRPTI